MKKRSKPRFAEMLDWLEGKLPEEEAQVIAGQLAVADEETLADFHWLRNFLETSRKIKFPSLPPDLHQELRARFDRSTGKQGLQNYFNRMLASLTFDSRSQPAVAGLRAADFAGSQRQLIFSTQVLEVVLSLQSRPQDERVDVFGQVFPVEDLSLDAFTVQLLSNTLEAGITMTDAYGEFIFKQIPMGMYELILSTDRFEVLIPSIRF